MFDFELQNFLDRHGACADGKTRLQSLGVETLEQAWNQVSDEDMIWAVTRPGVMSSEQKQSFLVMVLSSIEDKLTDVRSLNILKKLRTKETIKSEDRDAAGRAAWAAARTARAAARAAESAAWAAESAARAACAAAAWAEERAAEWAASAASRAAAADAADAAAAAQAASAARNAQARWIRDNFALTDLNIK